MANFSENILLDLNPRGVPCVDTHFYEWLNINHSEGWNRMDDKRNYLASFGYVYGESKIKQSTIDLLNSIHAVHFYNRVKSKQKSGTEIFSKNVEGSLVIKFQNL